MKKQFASVVCASALLGASSMAFAGAYGEKPQNEELPAPVAVAPAPQPEPENAYWYLGAGAVTSVPTFDPGYGGANEGWGYNVRGGRRFCDMFAAELEWEHVPGGFETSKRVGDNADTFAVTANGKVYPIKGQFQPYALVGVGYEHVSIDAHGGGPDKGGFAARFGLGLDVLITDAIGISAEADYLLPTGKVVNNFGQVPISLGVFYNFL